MRTDSVEFKAFLTRWRNAIQCRSALWEGPRAGQEIRKTGYWDFIRCKPDLVHGPMLMFEGVLAEAADYRKQKEAWQKEFLNVQRLLANLERKLKFRSTKTTAVPLKSFLQAAASGIEEQRSALQRYMDGDTRHLPLGPTWERLWPNRLRSENINRGIDLDARLQLQCAKILRIFLRELSVRTIARLIVLIYWTTDLATVKDEKLWIVTGGRRITVRAVEEKLIRNRFPRKPNPPAIALDKIPWIRKAKKRMERLERIKASRGLA